MYKCGWQGCEKAYGTLNHLNAHVTMQSHGQKRTPEGMHHLKHIFYFSPLAHCWKCDDRRVIMRLKQSVNNNNRRAIS